MVTTEPREYLNGLPGNQKYAVSAYIHIHTTYMKKATVGWGSVWMSIISQGDLDESAVSEGLFEDNVFYRVENV